MDCENNKDEYMDIRAEEEDIEVFALRNLEDKNIVCVIKEGEEYYLNSRYSDMELIESWCSQYDIGNYRTIALVFGMGNGEYIRTLRKKNRDMLIIVFEPSYSIAVINRDIIGIEDFNMDDRIIIAVGKEGYDIIYAALLSFIDYEDLDYVKLFISPNYDRLFRDELSEIKRIYKERISAVVINRNTMIKMRNEITDNIAGNMLDCIKQYPLSGLVDKFKDINIEGVPAIIVAAGPSLDKNIWGLKKAMGKAFIIAVDTALNSLEKAGIMPDISITVDPHKPVKLFERMYQVPLVFSLSSNKDIKVTHKGMRIYQKESNETILERYINQFNKSNIVLESGGSVAHDAFSLAKILGFKTIIFVGLDLAYPSDKKHAKEAYGSNKGKNVSKDKKEYFYVDDIYGEKVKTEYNMNHYRLWFERAAIIYGDIKFIDATEGGAKKRGMEVLTLNEAIERECQRKALIDFKKIIESTEKYFTDEQVEYILEDLKEFPEYMKNVRRRISEGIKVYNTLDELNRKQKYVGKEFERTIQRITEINAWLGEDSEIKYLNMYAADKDYQVREEVFDEKENLYEEIKHIAHNGRDMLSALYEATYKAEDDVRKVIEES